jgi:hypothetical protein
MNFINDDITPILTRCSCGCIVLNMKQHLETNKHKILIEESHIKPIILKPVKRQIELIIPLKQNYEIKPYINFNDDE